MNIIIIKTIWLHLGNHQVGWEEKWRINIAENVSNNRVRVGVLLNMDEDEGLSLEGSYEMSFVRVKAKVWVRLYKRMENGWMSSQREVDKKCMCACVCLWSVVYVCVGHTSPPVMDDEAGAGQKRWRDSGEKDEGEAIKRKWTTEQERELWIIFVHRRNTLERTSARRGSKHNAIPDRTGY